MINKKVSDNKIEEHVIQKITQQIVRYLYSQYLNTSDQPIGFQWSQFEKIIISFCSTHFIKSFDKITPEERQYIANIITLSAREECLKMVNPTNIDTLPVRHIYNEIDLLNSIFFDCTVSFLNYNYHKEYFSKFFEYNAISKTPSISKYLSKNRDDLKLQASQRLNQLMDDFNIDSSDRKLLHLKIEKYYQASLN